MILNLSGEVIPNEWAEMYRYFGFNSGFYCPQDVRDAVAALEPGEELTLEINSIGGVVDAGSEIYSILRACKNPTRAVIQSMAASAASYMILGCDRIEIEAPAQMMIHNASVSGASGNKTDMQRTAQMLDACDQSILNVYCARCGDHASREQLEKLMQEETFLSAQDALRLGFVDAIIGAEAPAQTGALVASAIANNFVRAMRTLPDIGELTARRDQEAHDRLSAELEIEKNRY